MIGSAGTGKGFGGLARYLLHGKDGQEPDRAAWVAFRNVALDDPELVPGEMRATASQNPRVEKPVYHVSLSAPREEPLSREEWEKVVDRLLRDLRLHEHQVMIVAHEDRAHQHVHLIVNRVHPGTLRAWDNGHDYRRIERSLRLQEREMGLREVPGHHFRLAGQEPPDRSKGRTSGETKETERTGKPPFSERVRFATYKDFKEASSWAELEKRLKRKGLRLEARGRGLVVTDGRREVKASRIYRRGSRAHLEKRFSQGFRDWRAQVAELRGKVKELEGLLGERSRLQAERTRLAQKSQRTRDVLARSREAVARSEALRQGLSAHLALAYRPSALARAERRLGEIVRREGHAQAARVLRDRPGSLGALRGMGVGPLANVARRDALAASARASQFLEGLGRIQGELAAAPAREAAALRSRMALTARISAVGRRLDQATSGRDATAVEREVAQIGLRMGMTAVRLVLPEPASRVVSVALRGFELARDLGRTAERSMGR